MGKRSITGGFAIAMFDYRRLTNEGWGSNEDLKANMGDFCGLFLHQLLN